MYFYCIFFHTILIVAQNAQRYNFTIIPECYSVSSVMFMICTSPGVCFVCLQTNSTKFISPIVIHSKYLFWLKLYSDSEYTDTVSLFGFCPLIHIVHIMFLKCQNAKTQSYSTFLCTCIDL